jgi:arsenate reductase/ArsR family transcriptional regulator
MAYNPAMLEQFETAARAVADPSRLRILKMLEPGELCVCQITAVLGLAPATVSKHLALLRAAGLVGQRKDGRWVYYRLAGPSLNPYAASFLALVAGALGDDLLIAADRARLSTVTAIPLATLCLPEVPS